jgi:hypothetical protein
LINTAKNLTPTRTTAEELGNTEETTGRYYSYTTLTSKNFWAIATANLSGNFTGIDVPASSTLVFEVDSNNQVSAWLNDTAFNLYGCDSLTCLVDDYARHLQDTVVYTNLSSTCSQNPFIQ